MFLLQGEQFAFRHPQQPAPQYLSEGDQRIIARAHDVKAMQNLRAVSRHFLPIDQPAVGVDGRQVDDPLDGPFDKAAQDLREDTIVAPKLRHPGGEGAAL